MHPRTVTPTLTTPPADLRRRRELANFLRTRRESLSPAQRGLPERSRRRVSGLRREEVAELAGISASWYTWLEQGRDIHISADTVERLANALELAPEEREQLFVLAELNPPRVPDVHETVPENVLALIDAFDPMPALVICSRWDVIAWNSGAALVFCDFEQIPLRERNVLWLLLQHEEFRSRFVEDERMLRCVMGHFRHAFGPRMDQPEWTALVHALERSSERFRILWQEHLVAKSPDWRKEIAHPGLGRLTFDPVTLSVPPDHNLRVLFYQPADSATSERVRELVSSQPRLASQNSRPVLRACPAVQDVPSNRH